MRLVRAVFFNIVSLTVVITAFAVTGWCAQHDHDDTVESIPLEILTKPLPLRTGIGSFHEKVTTKSEKAQQYYDQGMAYLHSYVWIEAARSFNEALRDDRNLAMAYVGLSYAYTGFGAQAAAIAALDKALTVDAGVSPAEAARIGIRRRQLAAIARPEDSALMGAYRKSVDDALANSPSDPELWILKGNAVEDVPNGRGQHGGKASVECYLKALELSPDNFVANHYLIHCYENIDDIPNALKHAEAYVRLAPAIPHAHHMYGHDLRRVGRIMDAIAEFRQAYNLEMDYYETEHIPAKYDWHHQHNLDLLSTSYQYIGQMKQAEKYMKQSFETPALQANLEFNKKEWPAFLLATGRPEDAIRASKMLAASSWPLVSTVGHIMQGRALLQLGRVQEASAEANSAIEELKANPSMLPHVKTELGVLQGEFFLRTGRTERGRTLLKSIEKDVRSEPGPDAWSAALFTLESIARIAWRASDWDLAEYTADQMIQHDPNYAGSHYQMAVVARHKGENRKADTEFRLAAKYWRDADPDLKDLMELRKSGSP